MAENFLPKKHDAHLRGNCLRKCMRDLLSKHNLINSREIMIIDCIVIDFYSEFDGLIVMLINEVFMSLKSFFL